MFRKPRELPLSRFDHIRSLRRLLADQRGNALMISAAAIIPIIACIGGGLDVSRAYLVKSRLNEACDAAALAGRRAMTNEDISTAVPEATKFFNFNFPQNFMGTASFTPQVTHPDTGVVRVTASTSTPTTLMRLFGYGSIPVKVTCDATQNFDNIDVVLVLDTTGSMAYDLNNNFRGDTDPNSKMYALRQAVMALYDELKSAQDQLAAQGLRLRYGIVPYSSAVNVGKLIYAQNPNYMISGTYPYQSREPVYLKDASGNFILDNRGRKRLDHFDFKTVNYDISSFVAGQPITVPTANGGRDITFSWAGCIEERQTTSSITGNSSTASIPAGATDLNIDLIPSDDATRWKPYLSDIHGTDFSSGNPSLFYASAVYDRSSTATSTGGSAPFKACPPAAAKLQSWSRSDMQAYVDSLFSDGYTYHDLGMIWGARLISPNGIFGSDNPSTFSDRPVHRYVIFMTDGMLDTLDTLYSSYGIEHLDKRVTGGFTSKSNMDARHRTRFLMACTAAKQAGDSIWSIVFALDDDATLQTCASSPDQYALSRNGADLIAKFKEIGKNIGTLRLAK